MGQTIRVRHRSNATRAGEVDEGIESDFKLMFGNGFVELKAAFDQLPLDEQNKFGAIFGSDASFMNTANNGCMWIDEMSQCEDTEGME